MLKIFRDIILILLSAFFTTALFCLIYQLPFMPSALWYGYFPFFGLLFSFIYGFCGGRSGGSCYLTVVIVGLLLLFAAKEQLPFASHCRTAPPLVITLLLALAGEAFGGFFRMKRLNASKLYKKFQGTFKKKHSLKVL